MPKTQIAVAGRLKPGDIVVIDGDPRTVARIKRAQGRKPSVGENLHLVDDAGEIIRVNSMDAVRITQR